MKKQKTIKQVLQEKSKWETKFFYKVAESELLNDLKILICPLTVKQYGNEFHIARIKNDKNLKYFHDRMFLPSWFCLDLGLTLVPIYNQLKKLGGREESYRETGTYYIGKIFVFDGEEKANEFIQWYEENVVEKIQYLLTIHMGL